MSARDAALLGMHAAMPAAEYHSIHALSAGGLRRLTQTPAHFYAMQLDPLRPPSTPTPAMQFGTLFHAVLFEPDQVAERYIERPDGIDLRTKDGRAWKAQCNGLEIVDRDEMSAAHRMAASVHRVPELARLLAVGKSEQSAFWIDEETGELCKCRPDWVAPAGDGVILVDGKSTTDASPGGFARKVFGDMRYDLQAAHYSEGWERAMGQKVHGFIFAAVESSYPHLAAPFMLNDDDIEAAMRDVRHLRRLYAECKASGEWPGYSTDIQVLNRPAWARIPENEEWQQPA